MTAVEKLNNGEVLRFGVYTFFRNGIDVLNDTVSFFSSYDGTFVDSISLEKFIELYD